MSKLLYSWLFIGLSEHHHTTQTSKFNNSLNGASAMLNNVFKGEGRERYNSATLKHIVCILLVVNKARKLIQIN